MARWSSDLREKTRLGLNLSEDGLESIPVVETSLDNLLSLVKVLNEIRSQNLTGQLPTGPLKKENSKRKEEK
ncbi:MAG: hypothetical protein P9L97_11955 [Candidatus Tenebribacter davisii]|nr:hypothetical protein [Candidatus Tenebribacter davisii]